MSHITVLGREAVEGLAVGEASLVVDCTYGTGGHTKLLLAAMSPKARLIALDVDPTAFTDNESIDERLETVVANFRTISTVLANAGHGAPDAILADLGWRSEQFESSGKGFSFTSDEPLIMTFGTPKEYLFTAADIVNDWEEENLADIIYAYGEEVLSRKIARAIVATRSEQPITTARQLADIVTSVKRPRRQDRVHPATQTFQAIRITVNEELAALRDLLTDGFSALAPGGRMAIISFHSLEDRLVKRAFRTYTHDQLGRLVTKKPIVPTAAERAANPRARSAKLRIIEKV